MQRFRKIKTIANFRWRGHNPLPTQAPKGWSRMIAPQLADLCRTLDRCHCQSLWYETKCWSHSTTWHTRFEMMLFNLLLCRSTLPTIPAIRSAAHSSCLSISFLPSHFLSRLSVRPLKPYRSLCLCLAWVPDLIKNVIRQIDGTRCSGFSRGVVFRLFILIFQAATSLNEWWRQTQSWYWCWTCDCLSVKSVAAAAATNSRLANEQVACSSFQTVEVPMQLARGRRLGRFQGNTNTRL